MALVYVFEFYSVQICFVAVNLPTPSMQRELNGIVSDPNALNLINIETFAEFENNRDEMSRTLLNAMCNSKSVLTYLVKFFREGHLNS